MRRMDSRLSTARLLLDFAFHSLCLMRVHKVGAGGGGDIELLVCLMRSHILRLLQHNNDQDMKTIVDLCLFYI